MNTSIENLLRPLMLEANLDSHYRAMAADTMREAKAQEWCDALNTDQNYFNPEQQIQGDHKL